MKLVDNSSEEANYRRKKRERERERESRAEIRLQIGRDFDE